MKETYRFLPFRFNRLDSSVLLANDVGDYCFLSEDIFQKFVKKILSTKSQEYQNLESKFMACNSHLAQSLDLLATRYRTKKQFLYDFTSLHMFVVTHRCNNKCTYCHASSCDDSLSGEYDMTIETAKRCVDLAFCSPSMHIKIEFQGGEPLLVFDKVKFIVEYSNEQNKKAGKNVSFVICTNLTSITSEQLDFIKKYDIAISTSLDGPAGIHDKCRKSRTGNGTYDKVEENLSMVIESIGIDKVSALTTVTPYNIYYLREVVDDYLRLRLTSVFLRMINPYGYAVNNWNEMGYSVDDFVTTYKNALEHIISVNLAGHHLPEEFATLLLTRILTPFATGFVDLQSPTGAGIGGAIYEINGDVFMADEGRMLAKMNKDKTFCIGNANYNTWHEIFCSDKIRKIIEFSCIEAIPGCSWCAYQPYCGNDPIRNYVQFGQGYIGNSSRTDFCRKHKAVFDILFDYLKRDDDNINEVFWSWITRRTLADINN